jgi:plastocyanin
MTRAIRPRLSLLTFVWLAILLAGCQPTQPTPTSAPKPAGPSPSAASPVAAASPSPAAGVTVKMVETAFEPDRITIPAGTPVTWDNTSLSTHTVTAEGGAFDSGSDPAEWLQSGQKFSFTFTAPGTFNYYCLPHQQLGMVGTVVVQ